MSFILSDVQVFVEVEFLSINSSKIVMIFLLDWMSLIFMSFVLFISSMVIFYSEEYMSGDKNLKRFILLVVMFVVSMMLMVLSPNMISILLGWDGLGLISYCLVIYYQNIKSFNAGMLTILSNRVGDVALLICIAWMMNYGSWNFMFYLDEMKGDLYMYIISWLVVLASITKSAQIPFSAWLPAAMAAPTPVSSLVHSSTLVTAGVYLLIRFNFCFDSTLLFFLLFISSMTMFMSGLGANFEFDLKKIIALSTLSQLGLMVSVLALGDYKLAFFHLLVHALFKALLFMCAGSMIHSLLNCQDIRLMGGVDVGLPLTCLFFTISNLALAGLPFLSGFYSKDLIMEFMAMSYMNIFIYLMFYISIGLTVCYSARLIYYLMLKNFYFCLYNSSMEGVKMVQGMSGLIFLVIFMGAVLLWVSVYSPYVIILSWVMKLMVMGFILLGMSVGWLISSSGKYKFSLFKETSMVLFLSSMWCMPYLSTHSLSYYPMEVGDKYFSSVDQGWGEYLGSQKVYFLLMNSSKSLQFLFYNNLKFFFILIAVWVIFVIYM
uniref:NADH-ubiquinone oxidoreductase chain 5 n=1 Tax=Pelecotoma fennica TaxID=433262 RepID=A0A343A486_9CUCU|nr:NADH dehydrogenase subunit 5 [Pelecotoma fennica]AOY39364.1 NADH dehydrogenase subunit 5 [Pelecotoma fennica]